jgi:OOP family OmpA-OmpF porin
MFSEYISMINRPFSNALLMLAFSTVSTATLAQSIAPPPQVQVPVSPGRVVISGAVPDEATKAALLGKLQELYGAGQIVDQISVGGVIAPPNWSTYIPKLMGQNLKSIKKGQLAVEGTTVSMRGEVGSEAVRQAIASDFALALNPTYVVKNGLRVTAVGQAVVDQTLANRTIEFEKGSALLTESGKAILDQMTEALHKISAKKIEVIGHTDSHGMQARNLALSRSRADSVKTYLVAKGIPSEIIGTSGMGADQPVTSNTTEEGRRRNRRIEFRVSQ